MTDQTTERHPRTGRVVLTPADRRRAERRIARQVAKNPLRRVRIDCCGWIRDPLAVVGDWVWCDTHADQARVLELDA